MWFQSNNAAAATVAMKQSAWGGQINF